MPPRPEFLEPLAPRPLSPPAPPSPPALSIRIPVLKTWRCADCSAVYPADVYECGCASFSDEEEEGDWDTEEDEEGGGYNPWYCYACDDFCPSGLGVCKYCML
jgi:hypothetical protein